MDSRRLAIASSQAGSFEDAAFHWRPTGAVLSLLLALLSLSPQAGFGQVPGGPADLSLPGENSRPFFPQLGDTQAYGDKAPPDRAIGGIGDSALGAVGDQSPYGSPTGYPAVIGPDWPKVYPIPWRPGARLRAGLAELFDPPQRFRGPGRPLLRESWRYRPFSAGWFMGGAVGSTLIDDWVGQKGGYIGGYRFGWDFHHYWGCEIRLAGAYLEVYDSQRAKDAQKAADDAKGLDPDDPFRRRFDVRRDSDLPIICDVEFLYYPWGDAAWRPYLLAGLGYAQIDFIDRLSEHWHAGALGIPLGAGVKYRWNEWLAIRVEFTDNILIPSKGINPLHELSLTAGVEIRFGGTRTAYWPWNPGLHYW